jgi:hypothetical protein
MKEILRLATPKWIVLLILIPVSLLFFAGSVISSRRQTQKPLDNSEPIDIGMVTLLAAPQDYDGKVVRTIGFMCLEFEGNALYLHEEDFRYFNTKNAVKLHLSQAQEAQFKNLTLKHVLIEGTVSASKWGLETGTTSGAIGKITRLEIWPARIDPPARR